MSKLQSYLVNAWYDDRALLPYLLWPFSLIYKAIVLLRKKFSRPTMFDVPVIVVGNITVGGTGKTPLVIWLANFLKEKGYKPGIVSRGYGGNVKSYPQKVESNSDPLQMGDEAVLLARHANCPVIIDPHRVNAVKYLLKNTDCNIVISDDGLQHYALGRQIEIAVVDGERLFGNRWCLPAGPLREPVSRLEDVDFMVVNGTDMHLKPGQIYNIIQPDLKANPDDFAGNAVHAIAGIGNPNRFFDALRKLKITIWPHSFPDHHQFTQQELDNFGNDTKIIMTEKDAVKCESFADYRYWCLPVTAELDPKFGDVLLAKLTSPASTH